MKKIFILTVVSMAFSGVMNAQRAGEFELGNQKENIAPYNIIGVSYNNTSFSNNWGDKEDNFSTNGFGVDYIHGFKLSNQYPMFIETGLNLNYNFGTVYEDYDSYGDGESTKMHNFNFQVPVNYVYRFDITDEFSIAPYFGLNFKLNLVSNWKYSEIDDEEKYEETYNLFSKDDMGEDTWNRFQMGWHIGSRFQYSRFSLSMQYGTDFIKAYSQGKDKINTGNFKITLGFSF